MKAIIRLISIVLIFFAILIIYESPISIVGEYPMLMAFISLLTIFVFLLVFLGTFSINKKLPKSLSVVFVIVLVVGSIGIIPGMIFNGMHFKKAKQSHLIENGIVTKAIITDKKYQSVTRRGRESKGYELYYSYTSKNNKLIQSWDVVSEEKFNSVNIGDSVFVIYSIKKADVAELIILQEEKEIYNEKLK